MSINSDEKLKILITSSIERLTSANFIYKKVKPITLKIDHNNFGDEGGNAVAVKDKKQLLFK